jgi:hypothetical protein
MARDPVRRESAIGLHVNYKTATALFLAFCGNSWKMSGRVYGRIAGVRLGREMPSHSLRVDFR